MKIWSVGLVLLPLLFISPVFAGRTDTYGKSIATFDVST